MDVQAERTTDTYWGLGLGNSALGCETDLAGLHPEAYLPWEDMFVPLNNHL